MFYKKGIDSRRTGNLKLKMTTDYALRGMMYLATNKGVIHAEDLSDSIGVTRDFIYKIFAVLRDHGLVVSYIGSDKGGYTLAKNPDEISLWEIVVLFEKKHAQQLKYENRINYDTSTCDEALYSYLSEAENKINDFLKSTSLQEVIERQLFINHNNEQSRT